MWYCILTPQGKWRTPSATYLPHPSKNNLYISKMSMGALLLIDHYLQLRFLTQACGFLLYMKDRERWPVFLTLWWSITPSRHREIFALHVRLTLPGILRGDCAQSLLLRFYDGKESFGFCARYVSDCQSTGIVIICSLNNWKICFVSFNEKLIIFYVNNYIWNNPWYATWNKRSWNSLEEVRIFAVYDSP